jgi:hypothetical protein
MVFNRLTASGRKALAEAQTSVSSDFTEAVKKYPTEVIRHRGFYYAREMATFAEQMMKASRESNDLRKAAVYRIVAKKFQEGNYPSKLPGQAFWDTVTRVQTRSSLSNIRRDKKKQD